MRSVPAVVVLALTLWAPAGASAAPPERFTVTADGHPLAVWARFPTSTPRGAVLLLHGRTWSSLPDFDLHVAGLRRSVLESLAAQGFAAYAMDQRGYGATPRDRTGWLTPERASGDVAVVLAWIAMRHPSLPRPGLVGWSTGAAVAHLTAVMTPWLLSSLVLYGYGPDPDTVYEAPEDEPSRPLMVKNTRESAASDFKSPKVTPRKVITAFVDAALKSDPIYADWRREGQFVYNSAQVSLPTLVIFGERDPNVDATNANSFVSRLGARVKQLVILPEADHCAHIEDTHDAWIAAIANFLMRAGSSR